jgi:hypothetical protein
MENCLRRLSFRNSTGGTTTLKPVTDFFIGRTNIGTEVDLVLSRGLADRPVAVEIKSATSPGEKDVVGLKAFKKRQSFCAGYVFLPNPFFLSERRH